MPKGKKKSWFQLINYSLLGLLAVVCLVPFIHVIALSTSGTLEAASGSVGLLPKAFNLEAFRYVMEDKQFIKSLVTTLQRVFIGMPISILLVILTAYPLSKTNERFHGRSFFSWFFVITMLFSGGLIPTYIIIAKMHLINSIWVLILPGAMNVYFVILMMNFFRNVPKEIEEAAIIDGAGQLKILIYVFLPMSMPSLATIVLFSSVANWNAWIDGFLYMNTPDHYPLQTYLATTLMQSKNNMDALMTPDQLARMADVSHKTIEAAQILLSALPIMCVYPFLQRYYIKGIVVGSVKG